MAVKLNVQQLRYIENWPSYLRFMVSGLVFLIVLGIGHNLLVSDINTEIITLKEQEATLKQSLAKQQSMAARLPAYQQQISSIDSAFHNLSVQLPTVAPTSQVLEDISKAGDDAGLSFGLIKPLPEIRRGFYMELPIQLSVTGTYPQLAAFISALTALPRIVTVGDFTIAPALASGSQDAVQLVMNLQVSAYRYNHQGTVNGQP